MLTTSKYQNKPKDEESKEEEMKVDEAVDTKEKTDTEEKPVHNKEKPFQANQCDHCLSQNSNLKMPIITVHNKEKPFSATSVIPRRLLQCAHMTNLKLEIISSMLTTFCWPPTFVLVRFYFRLIFTYFH